MQFYCVPIHKPIPVRAGGYSRPIQGAGCQNLAWGDSCDSPWECETATNCSYGGDAPVNPLPPYFPIIPHGRTCQSTAPCRHPYPIGQGVYVCGGPQAFVSFVCDESDGIASWVPMRNYPRTIY